jgi:predicted ATPase/class 3 adenylate cyclase
MPSRTEQRLPEGTITFLFTDIEGSTRLLQELGERYAEALAEHRRLLREAFQRHHGVEVDTQGDAFFVAFERASDALAAAEDGQRALAPGPVRVRIGLHSGEPVLTDEGYVGIDVHRAARIAAAGHGGQVLLSQSTRDLAGRDDLRDLGEHRLKDLAAPERIWQLGDGEFPRLKTLYQTNLPVPATPFLGREADLADVAGLLTGNGARLVTLTGPGGTGKTRLALQAAAESAEHFPDGVTWVPLAPLRDAALVLPTIAGAVGAKEEQRLSLQDALSATLGGRRCLLLLDNAEHLLPGVAEQLTVLRAIDGPSLLVTSRERLQLQGEHVYGVVPLNEEDAVRLFLERSAMLGVELERTPSVVELCDRLDDLPLALELAAARTPLFSPEQLLERLGARLDLLKGGRDADPRQQTLRATIAWSHELLDEDERRLFRRLSVFVGGCSFERAEEVCETDPETLQSLLDKSLVRRRDTTEGPWFWMLGTIRDYAAERLDESGERLLVEDRLIDAAVEFARAAEPAWRVGNTDEWVDRFDLERDNLRRAIAVALERGDSRRALSISALLGWLWQGQGFMREGIEWTERALAAADDLEPGLEGYALLVLGIGHHELGERAEGAQFLRQCLPLLEAGGWPHQHAFALYYLAGPLFEQNRVSEAEELLRQSEREGLALDDVTLIRAAREGLAEAYANRGDFASARKLLEDPERRPPTLAHRATQDVHLAEILVADGDPEKAESILDRARAMCEERGYRRELAWVLQLRGYLDVLSGRREAAVAALETARTMGEESGVRGVVGNALLGLAAVEARWGSPEAAIGLWSHSRTFTAAPREDSWYLSRRLEREFLEPLRETVSDEVFDRAWSGA